MGPRSAWPTEPRRRTAGTRPRLRAPAIISASSGRTPAVPLANPFTRQAIAALTTGGGAGGPWAMRWPLIRNRLKSWLAPALSTTLFRSARAVVRP